MANLEVMRAEAEWQRAGAYSVRIQGMTGSTINAICSHKWWHGSVGSTYW